LTPGDSSTEHIYTQTAHPVAAVQYAFTHKEHTRWQQYRTHLHTNSTPGGSSTEHIYTQTVHPVAVIQNTFTHKQYTDYRERNIHNNKKKKMWVSAGRAPSLRVIL
jgi:hypothetical protein